MKHILIIEDDTSIAELERDYLEANEITSEIVPNGELGLQKALHQDYDLILTGDLGEVGSKLLYEILSRENVSIQENHQDCGLLIYDRQAQDVHAGGSGCGCSASVLCSVILKKMQKGQLRNILFMATGALMSPTSSQQGESIPGVAHLINIRI